MALLAGDPVHRAVLEVTTDEAEESLSEVHDALAIRIAEAVDRRIFGG